MENETWIPHETNIINAVVAAGHACYVVVGGAVDVIIAGGGGGVVDR